MLYLFFSKFLCFSLYDAYPARAPLRNTTKYKTLLTIAEYKPGLNRSALSQAVYQLAGFAMTLAFAIVGGIITGKLLNYENIYTPEYIYI